MDAMEATYATKSRERNFKRLTLRATGGYALPSTTISVSNKIIGVPPRKVN
jgi:hypothetical protein